MNVLVSWPVRWVERRLGAMYLIDIVVCNDTATQFEDYAHHRHDGGEWKEKSIELNRILRLDWIRIH